MKTKTNPLSVKKIIDLASKVRKHFKIKDNTYFPILEVLESLEADNVLSLVILDDDDSLFEADTLAFYDVKDKTICVRNSVIDEYVSGEYRSSFTLAHEFFHFIQDTLNFSYESVEDCESFYDIEWQANEFAAQLLVPQKYVDCYSIQELADIFHVSLDCATVRKLYKTRRENKKLVKN